VLVGLLLVAVLLEGVLRPDLPWRVGEVVVTAGLVLTLLWRRTRPLLMVAIVFGAAHVSPVLAGVDPPEMYTLGFVLLLVYALFRWGSGREAVIGAVIIALSVGLGIAAGHLIPSDVIAAFTVMSLALVLGVAFRYRARARMREVDQIKMLERERLARDLHDTVAHHVSAMAIRAQAGIATSKSKPDAAVDALQVIEAEASRTLAEMRAMVRVLRRNLPADLAPSPRVRDLDRLAGRSRAGPAVEVEILGEIDDLSPSVGAAIYRLAQESVTNARRHSRHATRIEVRVAADDTSVHLRVSDDGDTNSIRPAASPGYGLVGMIERAGLLGGTCEAGPGPDRGWTVTAVLPRTGSTL
jgi:signal transduction histidine kinase